MQSIRLLFFGLFVMVATAVRVCAADSPREHLLLDADWKFHLGDDWPNALRLDKAGESSGPASEKFNDSAWRTLNLPHDWAIELPFDKTSDASHGFKPVGPGFPQNSTGWYRRTLDLPAEDAGKRIWLTFDGVFRDATVWVNGWLVRHHEGGYCPFREDITDIVKCGGKNVITVKVDASKFEGWFYEGAGIYRHVWLDKTAPVAIAPDGVFVRTEFIDNTNNVPEGQVKICADIKLINSRDVDVKVRIINSLEFSDSRKNIALHDDVNVRANSGGNYSTDTSSVFLCLKKYELWSPESPKLYKLITTVSVDGKVVDRKETEFGIRTFAFDKDKGFLLNGQPYALKGTCNHQDMAGVGAALPDAL